MLFFNLKKYPKEMSHRPRQLWYGVKSPCCRNKGKICDHGTQGKDIFATSTREIRENATKEEAFEKGFQQQKELNREQGTQARRENEIEGREKWKLVGGRAPSPLGKDDHPLWQKQDSVKINGKLGYFAEVLNWGPSDPNCFFVQSTQWSHIFN